MALEAGAAAIEVDVRQTGDSVLVVIHDESLDRTTGGSGKVSETPYSVIKDLNAGIGFESGDSVQKVPTLRQVMDRIRGRAHLFIEIKEGHIRYPGIEQRVVEEILSAGAQNWCSIQSFHFQVLERVHRLDTGIPLYLIVVFHSSFLPLYADSKLRWGRLEDQGILSGVQIHWLSARKKLIQRLRAKGLTVHVWTVNSARRAGKILNRGADGIITDDPAMIKKIMEAARTDKPVSR